MIKLKKLRNATSAGALAVATALTGMGSVGLSMNANAVNIAPDGLGEVLIFPYYTVRNGWGEFINIVNTSSHTVVFKIRWNEGENSRDARDFNVVLSPYDMWTSATQSNGAGNGAKVRTGDHSCTNPGKGSGWTAVGNPVGSAHTIALTNAAYSGKSYDNGSKGLDRTSEGYITIFEMGVVRQNPDGSLIDPDPTGDAQAFVDSANHGLTGTLTGANIGAKANYSYVANVDSNNTAKPDCRFSEFLLKDSGRMSTILHEPENVLKGRAVLIQPRTGAAAGYDPTVLANFYNPGPGFIGVDGASAADMYTTPATTFPNMNSANPAVAIFPSESTGITAGGPFATPVDAVSAVLARNTIINDYQIANGSATDWVVTFPTKGFYVDADIHQRGGIHFKIGVGNKGIPAINAAPYAPFDVAHVGGEVFADSTILNPSTGKAVKGIDGAGQSCVNIQADLWDREEFKKTPQSSDFSPIPDDDTGQNQLCYEANVISFGNNSVFYDTIQQNPGGGGVDNTTADYKLYSALFENDPNGLPGYAGWARVRFNAPAGGTGTFTALPVVGMRIESRRNPQVSGQTYGMSSQHAYKRGAISSADFQAP